MIRSQGLLGQRGRFRRIPICSLRDRKGEASEWQSSVTGIDRFLIVSCLIVGKRIGQLTRNVILWLSDIHPESLHIIRVELVISSDCGEDLLFNGCWSELSVSSGYHTDNAADLNTV